VGLYYLVLLIFQGPDIDPYLPWVREVDVATMMAELSRVIETGAGRVPPPSGDSSSYTEERRLEKEFFDVEGISLNFGISCYGSF
jgi:hypothetical protein